MDAAIFLQCLRDLSLEEGQDSISERAGEIVDHAAFGMLLKDEALRLQNIDPLLSLKLAELLIFFGDTLHHAPSHAFGCIAKGNALATVGYHQAAIACFDRAGEEFLLLGDEVGWARSRIMWIYSCAFMGRTREALKGAEKARALFMKYQDYSRVCTVDHNTAIVYTQLGDYQKALDTYEKILAIYPTLPDQSATFIRRATALAHYNQARNLSWLGHFEQAHRLLQRARSVFIDLDEIAFILDIEVNVADIDYAQGYYGSALRRYYQARDEIISRGLDDQMILAWLTMRIASCLVKLNRMEEACELAAVAVEAHRKRGSLLDVADALREYATVLVASYRLPEALAALHEALALFVQGGLEHHASATKLQQAELLLETGSASEAYQQARALKAYFDTQGLVARATRASVVMVKALIHMARDVQQEGEQRSRLLQEAALLCKQAVSLARQHNLQEQAYKSQHLSGRLAVMRGDLAQAGRHYRTAIAYIERMLNDLAYDLGPSFLHTTWTVYEDMIALCLQRGQVEGAFSYLERARSMALRQYLKRSRVAQQRAGEPGDAPLTALMQANGATILRTQHELQEWQQRYHKYSTLLADSDNLVSVRLDQDLIQAELKQCEARLSELFERLYLHQSEIPTSSGAAHVRGRTQAGGLRAVPHLNVAQIRRHLLPNQLLLTYYMYEGRLVIFAMTAGRLVIHEDRTGAAQVERLLLLLHAHLQPGGWPDLQRPPQQAIRRLLYKLYELLVAPIASLLPEASGYLTIVPYGALHKLPFHALYNGSRFLIEDFQVNYLPASSILMHLEARQSERVPETQVSGRAPLVFGYSGAGHLPHALEEAKALAALLHGRCYLEDEATIARLIEESPASSIIHLATHGKSRLDAPNFSYVRLADGQLNAIDAFSMDLSACELVTLSGCETGLAMSGGGDEQLGLGRAFLAAGAASLVMSLWAVEDNATHELMQLLYHHLLQGDSKGQALRAAQCALLRREASGYAHPYFWASFRLVGDASHPLTVSTRKTNL